MTKLDILPGVISDPHWHGPRCGACARPVGGDATQWKTCEDVPQAHMTLAMIPPAKRDSFFVNEAWTNAQNAGNGLLDAIDWMTAGEPGKRAVDQLRNGEGLAVLERQFTEWPHLLTIARRLGKVA